MSYNRRKSYLEELTVKILQDAQKPMTIAEIVAIIKTSNPTAITGKTPEKSLYSIIYRNEKRRINRGEEQLFIKEYDKGDCLYSLKEKAESQKKNADI